MDGTEKLPQRIFAPACDLPGDSKRLGTFALCFAAWLAFVQKQIHPTEPGETSRLPDDPRAREIKELLDIPQGAEGLYDRLANLPGWMPTQLHDNPHWRKAVISRLSTLLTRGADAAIADEIAQ
jgi:fructuronate reductase